MWRSLFLALGVYACLLGAECLLIDKAVLTSPRPSGLMGSLNPVKRELVPTDWAPWSLISGGAVTILYSFTLPKRMQKA
ncbi:MAG TPA: hypothetical protein VGX76_20890 [Pirellulales bacterium]|jgi:hypothetical protein|nr:hypothetical protein [Pirellulales bacterium]